MPKIDFCFQGLIRGAEVSTATNGEGETVDVSGMTDTELCDKLEAGDLFLSLGDFLYDNHKEASIEVHDFSEDERELEETRRREMMGGEG